MRKGRLKTLKLGFQTTFFVLLSLPGEAVC